MKIAHSLLTLLAVSFVTAGPIPNNGNALITKRTGSVAEPPAALNSTAPPPAPEVAPEMPPAPAPEAAPAPAANPDEQKAAEDKAGMSDRWFASRRRY